MSLVPSQPINAQDTPPPFDSNTLYMPGEIVVGFSSMQSGEALLSQALALADEMNAQVVDLFANVVLLRFAENANVPALGNQIGGMRGVSYAEPNYIRWIPEYLADPTAEFKDRWVNIPHSRNKVTFRVMNAKGEQNGFLTFSLKELRSMKSIRDGQAVPTWPNDPFLWAWGWDWSNASEIWTDKAPNPPVCVVDTGVDDKHPDLMGRVLAGKDFVNDDGKPDDDNGHGTHVAGTIAAIMNNKKGFAGISTAKIVPVKVLSAQRWGTSFDIAQGIVYCANLANVKIINLSLGGYDADLTDYNALNYAINTKGKLVVAAAGNGSRYRFTFPAAWAVEWVCKDGTDNYPTDCSGSNDNVLAPGLISVGASQLPWGEQQHDVNGDGLLWVDTNGDGQEPLNTDANYWEEHFWPDMCAADFSQYGAWVEMVAPGEEILSAQPVSYNFWNHYFWGADSDGDGYEWYSGTSMSTPHVAGSAARVWGTFPSKTNIQIASQLQTAPGWNKMTPAMDPNMLNPAVGYHDTGYKGEAPYCWPNATYGGRYDMSSARFVDVAAAMNRFAIWYAVSDAITGLPLSNATVSAYVGTSNTLADKTIIAKTNR